MVYSGDIVKCDFRASHPDAPAAGLFSACSSCSGPQARCAAINNPESGLLAMPPQATTFQERFKQKVSDGVVTCLPLL